MLYNRLRMCAEMVSGKGIACDVGTDHAYLATDLVMSGKCSRVIASDVKEGPLDSARKTVEKFGVADKVDLVMSDGLENIDLNGVTDIVIAGMGGETIVKILEKKVYDLDGVRLILQPMSKPEILRKWLYQNVFQAVAERAVEDGDKMYTVICAEHDIAESIQLTEFETLAGFFEDDDPLGKKYRQKESARLEKIGNSLKNVGMTDDAEHYFALSKKILHGAEEVFTEEIYNFLDKKYPFNLQEKWDNSGFLVNTGFKKCRKVMLTLDITNLAVHEADAKKADLIISHHPVIFDPIKKINYSNPVYSLVENGISAICMHTNLDIAEGGTNTVILRKIGEKCELSDEIEPLEDSGLGYIFKFKEPVYVDDLSAILKGIFKTDRIKVSRYGKPIISKVAICSGSGGSLLDLAIAKNCDALITGDVKHNVWIEANDSRFMVFDCGHFHTENLVLTEIRRVLEEKFPLLDVEIADSSVDPCKYY